MPTDNNLCENRDYRPLWHDEYSLVYLDPMICDPSLRVKNPLRVWFGSGPQVAVQKLLNQLEQQLGLDSSRDEKHCYLDATGAGKRLKSDRRLQAQLEGIIKKFDDELGNHKRDDLETLQSKTGEVAALADTPDWRSLVVVEAGFAHSAKTPGKLAGTIEAPIYLDRKDTRATIGTLTRHPSQLIVLGDPTLGLRADVRAFYDWTEDLNRILFAGWHPYAKVIGIYNTSSQGKPYLDVLALLFKRCPSLREVIQNSVIVTSDSGETANGSTEHSPPAVTIGLLDAIAMNTVRLHDLIVQFKDREKEQTTNGSASLASGMPSAPGASDPSQAAAQGLSKTLPFHDYRECLMPFYHFQLICCLNGVSADALRDHASPAYEALTKYLAEIKAVQRYLDEQGKRIHQETDITALFPEPQVGGARMVGRAIP